MSSNFFELFTIEPAPGESFSDPHVIKDLQYILDQSASGIEGILFQFRKSSEHPNRLVFAACWESIAGHDDMDIQGTTLKVLKVIMANAVPVAIYLFFADASKVDFEADTWSLDAFHVKDGERDKFQGEFEKNGCYGGWYITKKVPPRPTVMPTDPKDIKFLEIHEERARDRLAAPNPSIWILITSSQSDVEALKAGSSSLATKVDSGKWEKYLSGSSFISLN